MYWVSFLVWTQGDLSASILVVMNYKLAPRTPAAAVGAALFGEYPEGDWQVLTASGRH